MKIEIHKNPKDYDSDDVHLMGKHKGFAYVGREKGNLGLIRCPECGRENYRPFVTSGKCAWCDYDANVLKEEILKSIS